MNHKLLLLLFLIIASITPSDAIRVYNNGTNLTKVHPTNTVGWINISNGNFSGINVTANYLILNSSFLFNSSANITLSNLSYNNDKLNFTAKAISGTLNGILKMLNSSYGYGLYIDNIFNKTITSNSSGYVIFNYSSWSQHDFYISGYVAPVLDKITISPSNPSSVQNLTATLNVTRGTLSITNHTLWYKNNVLQTTLNDSLLVVASGNTSDGQTWRVDGYIDDGVQNTSISSSNNVIIGSGNSAPTFTALTLYPSTKKNNQTIYINASGITDDSTSWQLQTYYKNPVPIYIVNSTFVSTSSINITATVPFTTGGAHVIYAVLYDSGNVSGQSNLTSAESQTTFTSDVTPSTIVSSSLSASSITVGGTVTITAQFNGQGANISSAIVRVERPDATIANWSMTCDSGEIVNCTKSYTSTSDIGTYYIRYFYPKDTAGIEPEISSILTFTASTASASSGGSGGGGTVIINPTPTATSSLNLSLVGVTEGARNVSELSSINECLTNSFLLSNQCTSVAVIVLKDSTNWYTLLGTFIASVMTIFGLNLISKKKRSYFDSLIYSVIIIISTLAVNLVGFNAIFLFNYIFSNSLSAFTFMSFALYGFIGTVFLDEVVFKKPMIYTVRKMEL